MHWGLWDFGRWQWWQHSLFILILCVHIVIPSLFNRLCSSSGVVWDRLNFNLYSCSPLGLAIRTPCVLFLFCLFLIWYLCVISDKESQARKDIFATCHDWICVLTHHQPRVCIFSYPLLYLAENQTPHWGKKRLKMTFAKHLCPLFNCCFLGPMGCNMNSGTLKDPHWQCGSVTPLNPIDPKVNDWPSTDGLCTYTLPQAKKD